MTTPSHPTFSLFVLLLLSPHFLLPSAAMLDAFGNLIQLIAYNFNLRQASLSSSSSPRALPPAHAPMPLVAIAHPPKSDVPSAATPSPSPSPSLWPSPSPSPSPSVPTASTFPPRNPTTYSPQPLFDTSNSSSSIIQVATNTTQKASTSDPPTPADELVKISSPVLRRAHAALHAWKRTIISDPNNFTGNWVGHDVCSYNGIVCAPSLDDPSQHAVAGIDFNGANLAGHLPIELVLFKEVSLIHVNSNRFHGQIPRNLSDLMHLEELDLSNNGFVGPFPKELLQLPKLKYLDLRFNNFEGPLPPELFDKNLDALFLNDNHFNSTLPENVGNSKVSVMVLANNNFEGPIPKSIGKMGATLNELVLTTNNFSGCLPRELRQLGNLTVVDFSDNSFAGLLPTSIVTGLKSVEQLNLADNVFTGVVPNSICKLKHLTNFTYSSNYFKGKELNCAAWKRSDVVLDGRMNCMAGQRGRRTAEECAAVLRHPVTCGGHTSSSPSSSAAPSIFEFSPPGPSYASPPPPPPPSILSVPPLNPSLGHLLPPVGGFGYASPPPPIFKGY